MSANEDLQSIALRSIESNARLDTRVASLEQSITMLRAENEKILGKISESLERLAAIQEKLTQNHDQHAVLHKRIDDVKEEADSLEDVVTNLQKNCAGAGHAEMSKKVVDMDRQLSELVASLNMINYRLFNVPVWLIIVGMTIFSFISTIANHYEWAKKWLP